MDQEKLQLTGSNTRKKDRNATDFYPTPPKVTEALIYLLNDVVPGFEAHGYQVWEPACGDLAMSNVLDVHGHSVISTDINTGHDFLTCKRPADCIDAIITNPPFSLASEFITRALKEAPVVAMLLKSQFWHAKKRQELFANNLPAYVCPITWRVDFLNGAKGGRPTMEVLWTIWIKGNESCVYKPLLRP